MSLLVGALVYLLDRSAAATALMPHVDGLPLRHVFGSLGGWLPSAVHAFAFSLLSAAALPARAKPRYGACAAWCAIDLAFEFGQHPFWQGPAARASEFLLGWTPLDRPLVAYFARGTFDVADVAATVAGAAAAMLMLRRRPLVLEVRHAP